MKITDYFNPLQNKKQEVKYSLIPDSSWVLYKKIPNDLFLTESEFDNLWDLHPLEDQYVKIMGNDVKIPRWNQSYGLPYKFSGVVHVAKPIPEIIKPFIDFANKDVDDGTFNSALVNWYENGDNYIGFHSDDEKQLIKDTPIYCFSFGSERDFVIKNKPNINENKLKLLLENNSLVIMGGTCQKTHLHSIPKRKKINSRRISITLRQFK